jgi:hypothetical protein
MKTVAGGKGEVASPETLPPVFMGPGLRRNDGYAATTAMPRRPLCGDDGYAATTAMCDDG